MAYDRQKEIEQADREYYPCHNGLHVCGVTSDEERPLTVANVPGVGDAQFETLRGLYALPAGTPGYECDLIVDRCVDGDIVDDFGIRRQSLNDLLKSCKE